MRICLLITACFANLALAEERSFTDDLGVVHTTSIDKPKIVTMSFLAVTMSHYGLTTDQLLGTYGEHANSGSDLDFENPEMGSSFPADPTAEEVKFLQSVVNLSPGCGAEFCTEFNMDTFKDLKPDLMIMHGYRQSHWAVADHVPNITEAMGAPPIYLEVSLHGEDCTNENVTSCYGKSMIELIKRHMELAEFLNFDTPDGLEDDFNRMCESASNFQNKMEVVQQKGIRAMAAYLTTGTSYFATPVDDMVLRMFEELGMPLMHVGACQNKTTCVYNYFWEWIPIDEYFNDCSGNQTYAECNEKTLYPVDFWLYDHRTTTVIQSDDFAEAFPDKALLKKQYTSWPIGGRLMTPDHVSRILDRVGEDMEGAERIHGATDCVPDVEVTSVEHRTSHALGGLAGGEYACFGDGVYHNVEYTDICESSDIVEESGSASSDGGAGDGSGGGAGNGSGGGAADGSGGGAGDGGGAGAGDSVDAANDGSVDAPSVDSGSINQSISTLVLLHSFILFKSLIG